MARIIYIEDDPLAGEVVTGILNDAGHHCGTIPDGKLALDTVRFKKPEMVIVDLQLPGLSGCEILRKLRVEPGIYWMPILVLTGAIDDHAHQQALEAGANAVLTKHATAQELVDRVNCVLHSNALARK
ncbi:PleD family two-component system response regulator [Novosphingobium sp. FSW06-99]|uniref:response regulator n=1 Tax=Novosphingobium sp. FSW06-99 TaxID=1739113 RepID=UPI00076C03B5|nr:response regulator [Novosphingobium sp. FSW06-99]KUR74832.1 hypothetical protein AQZ49_16295 [Novosphingobium sp. FSW06-99]